MKALNYFQDLEYNLHLARIPITMMHWIVLMSVLLLQSLVAISATQVVLCILLFTIYNWLHWESDSILPKIGSIYFYIQGSIILLCTIVMPDVSPLIVLGLMPIFLIQGMYYYQQASKMIMLILGYAAFYTVLMYLRYGLEYLWVFALVFAILVVFLNLILFLFNQKEAENIDLHYYVKKLQIANQKIEQLTLQNERQRMARDLHDTLAQRLVGLILKLDASDAHIKKGNFEKVEEILHSAKKQAKESLVDARKVIDDLRLSESGKSFSERVKEELAQLQYLYHVAIVVNVENTTLTTTIEQHILSILKEAVTNVHKHAEATKIEISLYKQKEQYIVKIADNGKGIGLEQDLQKGGHYGILGMSERIQLMNGQMKVENKDGTLITLVIPVE